jgi:hypothetical protein
VIFDLSLHFECVSEYEYFYSSPGVHLILISFSSEGCSRRTFLLLLSLLKVVSELNKKFCGKYFFGTQTAETEQGRSSFNRLV